MDSNHSLYSSILDSLWKTNGSLPFQYPVDYKRMGLWDYPLVISKPMCLNDIRAKILANGYPDPYGFEADLMLIWDNCKKYNMDGSQIFNTAVKLEDESRRLLKEAFEARIEKQKEDLLKKRLALNKMRGKMSVNQLQQMLRVIRDENGVAMDFSSEKSFTVDLDKINEETLEKLLRMFSGHYEK